MGQAIEEFAATTTIHGVQTFLMTKRSWFKVIWGWLMVASILAMVGQLYQTFKEFSQAPVISLTSFEALDQWPTIIICPDKWFNASKAFDAGFNEADVAIIRKVLDLDPVVSIYNLYLEQGIQEFIAASSYLRERKTVFDHILAKANLTTVQDIVELIGDDVVKPRWPNGQVVKVPFTDEYRVCSFVQSSAVPPDYEFLELRVDSGGFFAVTRSLSTYGERYEFKAGEYVEVRIAIEGTSLIPKTDNLCVLDMDEMVCKDTCSMESLKCYTSPWNVPHMYAVGKRLNSLVSFNADNLTFRNYTQLREKCDKEYYTCTKGCISCTNWKLEIEKKIWKRRVPDDRTALHFDINKRTKMIRESWAYTETMLVSNVGGLVSWYLGASILSLVHLGFFCLSRCFDEKPQEVMAAEEGQISPVKESKKGRWTKLIWPFSRKQSV